MTAKLISVQDFILKYKSIGIKTLMRAYSDKQAPPLYVHITSDDNPLVFTSAFYPLSKGSLFDLTSIGYDGERKDLCFDITHPQDSILIEGNKYFLTLDQLEEEFLVKLNEIIDDDSDTIVKYHGIKNMSPDHCRIINKNCPPQYTNRDSMFRKLLENKIKWFCGSEEKAQNYIILTTNIPVAESRIFLEENDFTENLITSCQASDGLSREDISVLKTLANMIGMDKVRSLIKIFDKAWGYYSTEVNLIIDIHIDLFVHNKGNQKEGIIVRAAKLLKFRRPDIAGNIDVDPKRFTAAAKRITSAVNSDKK